MIKICQSFYKSCNFSETILKAFPVIISKICFHATTQTCLPAGALRKKIGCQQRCSEASLRDTVFRTFEISSTLILTQQYFLKATQRLTHCLLFLLR